MEEIRSGIQKSVVKSYVYLRFIPLLYAFRFPTSSLSDHSSHLVTDFVLTLPFLCLLTMLFLAISLCVLQVFTRMFWVQCCSILWTWPYHLSCLSYIYSTSVLSIFIIFLNPFIWHLIEPRYSPIDTKKPSQQHWISPQEFYLAAMFCTYR